jgi:hypothetical protein
VSRCDVAIIGAGPYGLSAAAHLRAAGVETRVFGHTMEFWERHMPLGMRLRSAYDACHISDPEQRLTLRHYEEASAEQWATPVARPPGNVHRLQIARRTSGIFPYVLKVRLGRKLRVRGWLMISDSEWKAVQKRDFTFRRRIEPGWKSPRPGPNERKACDRRRQT